MTKYFKGFFVETHHNKNTFELGAFASYWKVDHTTEINLSVFLGPFYIVVGYER